MRILLDTHCWLWLQTATQRFSAATLELLASPKTDLYLSAASTWEIVIKHALGKLPLPEAPAAYVSSRMKANGVSPLPILVSHTLRVADLPPLHRDPFDRVLIAQAQIDELTILTVDSTIGSYDVAVRRP